MILKQSLFLKFTFDRKPARSKRNENADFINASLYRKAEILLLQQSNSGPVALVTKLITDHSSSCIYSAKHLTWKLCPVLTIKSRSFSVFISAICVSNAERTSSSNKRRYSKESLRRFTKMIEVTCNDRLGKKVRVKCKYPYYQQEKNHNFSFSSICRVT